MATKYYGINDKWTDDDIENVIEVTSDDGSVDSVKVNGVEYGGGGGGGTALRVTVVGDQESDCFVTVVLGNMYNVRALFIDSENRYNIGDNFQQYVSPNDEYADLLLLKEYAQIDVITAEGYTSSVTGDATPSLPGSYNVTGNCTVTFTAI